MQLSFIEDSHKQEALRVAREFNALVKNITFPIFYGSSRPLHSLGLFTTKAKNREKELIAGDLSAWEKAEKKFKPLSKTRLNKLSGETFSSLMYKMKPGDKAT